MYIFNKLLLKVYSFFRNVFMKIQTKHVADKEIVSKVNGKVMFSIHTLVTVLFIIFYPIFALHTYLLFIDQKTNFYVICLAEFRISVSYIIVFQSNNYKLLTNHSINYRIHIKLIKCKLTSVQLRTDSNTGRDYTTLNKLFKTSAPIWGIMNALTLYQIVNVTF